MGGGFALLLAAKGYDAASVNYGMPPRDLDGALQGACPIVASYGAKDFGAKKTVRRLEDALTRAAVPHDVKLYPEAGHAFLNDALVGPSWMRPLLKVAHVAPEPNSAADAWRRIEAFFGEHLAS
jgi:carboxymethylenebutenolidase